MRLEEADRVGMNQNLRKERYVGNVKFKQILEVRNKDGHDSRKLKNKIRVKVKE